MRTTQNFLALNYQPYKWHRHHVELLFCTWDSKSFLISWTACSNVLDISCLYVQSTFIHFRNVDRQNSTNYEKSNILGHIGMPNNVTKCVFAISLHIMRPSHHLVPVDIHCSTSRCVHYILYIFFVLTRIFFHCLWLLLLTHNYQFSGFVLFFFHHLLPVLVSTLCSISSWQSRYFSDFSYLVFKMCDTKCVSNIFSTARKPMVWRQ